MFGHRHVAGQVTGRQSRLHDLSQRAIGGRLHFGMRRLADMAEIGIAAVGYADGYPRHAGSGTPVLVDGRRSATVGRVSMDMIAVDLSALPGSGPGSEVTLWGEGPQGSRLPIDEVAHAAGTIGYELMCGLAPRVPVRAVGGDGDAEG